MHASADIKERGTEKGKQNVDCNLERVVSRLESRVAEFGKLSQDIKALAEAVQAQTDNVRSFKRKQSDANLETDNSKGDNLQSDVSWPSSSKQGKQDEDSKKILDQNRMRTVTRNWTCFFMKNKINNQEKDLMGWRNILSCKMESEMTSESRLGKLQTGQSKRQKDEELENCVCKTQVMPPCPKPVLTPCLTLNTFNQYWRLMSEMSKSKLQ